jgi:hypothetical protein
MNAQLVQLFVLAIEADNNYYTVEQCVVPVNATRMPFSVNLLHICCCCVCSDVISSQRCCRQQLRHELERICPMHVSTVQYQIVLCCNIHQTTVHLAILHMLVRSIVLLISGRLVVQLRV